MSRHPSREESLFADALAQPPADRGAFLAKACGANVDLLAHLVALLLGALGDSRWGTWAQRMLTGMLSLKAFNLMAGGT